MIILQIKVYNWQLLKNKFILDLINSYKCKNKFIFGVALIILQIKVYHTSKMNSESYFENKIFGMRELFYLFLPKTYFRFAFSFSRREVKSHFYTGVCPRRGL